MIELLCVNRLKGCLDIKTNKAYMLYGLGVFTTHFAYSPYSAHCYGVTTLWDVYYSRDVTNMTHGESPARGSVSRWLHLQLGQCNFMCMLPTLYGQSISIKFCLTKTKISPINLRLCMSTTYKTHRNTFHGDLYNSVIHGLRYRGVVQGNTSQTESHAKVSFNLTLTLWITLSQ